MDAILITPEPIVSEESRGGGALISFQGIVRNENKGEKVKHIYYECHEPMVQKELAKIMEETRAQWPINKIAIQHRVGEVKAGETSLVVVVSTPHRQEGFEAIQYIVDQLKKRAPIWKKEFYETGEAKWL